jgi:hypothetical protein
MPDEDRMKRTGELVEMGSGIAVMLHSDPQVEDYQPDAGLDCFFSKLYLQLCTVLPVKLQIRTISSKVEPKFQ